MCGVSRVAFALSAHFLSNRSQSYLCASNGLDGRLCGRSLYYKEARRCATGLYSFSLLVCIVNTSNLYFYRPTDPFFVKVPYSPRKIQTSWPGAPPYLNSVLVNSTSRPPNFPAHYPWSAHSYERLSIPDRDDGLFFLSLFSLINWLIHPFKPSAETFRRTPMRGKWFLFFEVMNAVVDRGVIHTDIIWCIFLSKHF